MFWSNFWTLCLPYHIDMSLWQSSTSLDKSNKYVIFKVILQFNSSNIITWWCPCNKYCKLIKTNYFCRHYLPALSTLFNPYWFVTFTMSFCKSDMSVMSSDKWDSLYTYCSSHASKTCWNIYFCISQTLVTIIMKSGVLYPNNICKVKPNIECHFLTKSDTLVMSSEELDNLTFIRIAAGLFKHYKPGT